MISGYLVYNLALKSACQPEVESRFPLVYASNAGELYATRREAKKGIAGLLKGGYHGPAADFQIIRIVRKV